jgi:hypothetical protein
MKPPGLFFRPSLLGNRQIICTLRPIEGRVNLIPIIITI